MLELCTIDDVLLYPGMSGVADSEYPWITQLIRGFSQRAEMFTDREFEKKQRTEIISTGPCQRSIQLRAFGHSTSAVSAVYEDLDRVFGADCLVNSSGYFFDYRTGILSRDYEAFYTGRGVVKVVYNAGLGAVIADVPSDLRMAATMQCAFWYQRRNDLGVVQRTTQGGALSLNSPSKLLEEVEEVLSQYQLFSLQAGADNRHVY